MFSWQKSSKTVLLPPDKEFTQKGNTFATIGWVGWGEVGGVNAFFLECTAFQKEDKHIFFSF